MLINSKPIGMQLLLFEDSEPENEKNDAASSDPALSSLIDKGEKYEGGLEKRASVPSSKGISKSKKPYGVNWTWLRDYLTAEQAENCLSGFYNCSVDHEILDALPSQAYIVSLYRSIAIQKRSSIKTEYSSPEELIAKLVFKGSEGFFPEKMRADKEFYDKIFNKILILLFPVSKDKKDAFVESYEKEYLHSNREVPEGRNFHDRSIDLTNARQISVDQLRQFYNLLKAKYHNKTIK